MARTTIATDRLMRPIAEFSLGLRVGDIIHVGATAGTDARRELAGYGAGRIDVDAQSTRMFQNMEAALNLLGGHLDDVVRIKGYVDDVRDFAPYEAAAKRFFQAPYPSQMTVGSWGFPLPQAVVEADLVAVVGSRRHVALPDEAASITARDRAGIDAGGRFYCTALPRAAAGETLAGNIAVQTALALRSLAETLGAAGLALGDAVMLTVTLADIRAYPAFDEAFRRLFPPPFPARTVVVAPLCASDLLVAIECVAAPGGGVPIMGRGRVLGAASPAMLAGDMLYIGGQIGTAPEAAAIEGETVAAWQLVEALVREAGMGLEDIVSTTNVLTDWRDYRGFNAGFARFVAPPYPPRATISVGLVDPAARVQVEAIAHRDGRNARVIEVTTP